MKIDLYQIYYKDDQPLDSGCIPVCTKGRVMDMYENDIILELINNNKHNNCDLFGVTSWRMNEKTGLTFQDIKKEVEENPEYDSYSYVQYMNDGALKQNSRSEIGGFYKRLYEIGGIEGDNPTMRWIDTFCNYWIAKPHVIDRYKKFINKVLDITNSDKFLSEIFHKKRFIHREADYPIKPFIMEYLYGLFLVHNPDIKHYKIPMKLKKPGKPKWRWEIQREIDAANIVPGSLLDIYQKHQAPGGFGDKGTLHHYIQNYDNLFTQYRDKEVTVLEIGVCHGHSLRMWREYFPKARIIGIDINEPTLPMEGIEFYICDQNNPEQLKDILAGIKFDIIVDDGSHLIEHQITSIKNLFDSVNIGGIYVIEDMQNPESDIEALTQSFKKPDEIYDTREESGRYDDVLLVWKK